MIISTEIHVFHVQNPQNPFLDPLFMFSRPLKPLKYQYNNLRISHNTTSKPQMLILTPYAGNLQLLFARFDSKNIYSIGHHQFHRIFY